MCFRDKSYCSDAKRCANHETCPDWFSPQEKEAAFRWMGENAPVAFMSFAKTCKDFKEIEDGQQNKI